MGRASPRDIGRASHGQRSEELTLPSTHPCVSLNVSDEVAAEKFGKPGRLLEMGMSGRPAAACRTPQL